jgi:hypothetical protein
MLTYADICLRHSQVWRSRILLPSNSFCERMMTRMERVLKGAARRRGRRGGGRRGRRGGGRRAGGRRRRRRRKRVDEFISS